MICACGREVTRYPGKGLCDRCYSKQRRAKNPEYQRRLGKARNERYHEKHPEMRAASKLKSRYRLPHGSYDVMFARQGGKCAICLRPPPKSRRLCIDHDHETGTVRRLLCNLCNSLIGMAKENPFVVARALAYLHHYRLLPYWTDVRFLDLLPFDDGKVIRGPAHRPPSLPG